MKLLKKAAAFLTAAVMCAAFACDVSAENSDKVVDMADLLTDSDESALEEDILEVISKYGYRYDIVVVTTNSTDGKTAEEYADDYYDYNGYGYDSEYSGALLLVDMGDRAWHISTCGKGIDVFTDRRIDKAGEDIAYRLGEGNYYNAFREFMYCADGYIESYENNDTADSVAAPERDYLHILFVSVAGGAIVALIVCLIMKSQLKTAVKQFGAGNYIRRGSLNVQYSKDIFLYKNVSRVKIETDSGGSSSGGGSSTHTSSSGRTHGGGGGHF